MKTRSILIYLAAVNLLAFLLMLADKLRAMRGAWRISEAALFAFPLLGGGPGGTLAMVLFRHKIRHTAFRWGFPLLSLLELGLLFFWWRHRG